VERTANRKRQLTKERVEAASENGDLMIRGAVIRSTGRVPIHAGERMPVAWKDGRPQVVMMNEGNRTGGAPLLSPEAAAGVVEEIFTVTPPGTPAGRAEVWFRNDTQMVRILAASEVVPNGVSEVRWGLGSPDYFCTFSTSNGSFTVYKLNRPRPNEPFPKGRKPTATLVRTYSFNASPLADVVLGTVRVQHSLGPLDATVDMKYLTSVEVHDIVTPTIQTDAISGVGFGAVLPNGELAVVINFTSHGDGGSTAGGNRVTHLSGSLVVNAATGEILANHLASGGFTVYDAFCAPSGTSTITFTPSVAAAGAGRVTVLSVKEDPTSHVMSLNNYAVVGPAYDTGGACGSPSAAFEILRVAGEFARDIASLSTNPSTGSIASFQSSRTRMTWAGFGRSTGLPTTPLIMADLPRATDSEIAGIADIPANFFTGPTAHKLYCTQADLIYHSVDDLAPYDHQFFVAGINRATGAITIDLRHLKRLVLLKEQAHLARLTAAQRALTTVYLSGNDLQVVNSRAQLGALAGRGPAL